MIELTPKEHCTGCGACAYVCPKQCIKMEEDDLGCIYPVIDHSVCIECKRCQKACPIPLDDKEKVSYHAPMKAYAAWSSDAEERRTSASGGVAQEVYKKALEVGYIVAGAVQNDDFTVTIETADSKEGLAPFKNSKYVYSSALSLYPKISKLLKEGKKVLIIALPCQIAAIKHLFHDDDNLLLVDVVCHGVTPYRFLRQHISMLENSLGKTAVKMSFRDPYTYTYTFTFTLYAQDNQLFYAKRTNDGDTYQYGYHRMVAYRENCYHCQFARDRRVSDITLSDYKRLGKLAPCSYNELNVSSVLVNTEKGQRFVEDLIEQNKIVAEERPVREPIMGDPQLQHPSLKSRARKDFERMIIKNQGDYEKTLGVVMRRDIIRKRTIKTLKFPLRVTKKIIKVILDI